MAQRLLRYCHFPLFAGIQREDTTVIIHYSVRIRGVRVPHVSLLHVGSLNLNYAQEAEALLRPG